MFRQGAVLCHEALVSATKTAMAKVSLLLGTTLSPPTAQLLIPAAQLLTIPIPLRLRRDHRSNVPRRAHCQFYSTSSMNSATGRSSFKDDYDEWYSNGRVGSITTRQPAVDDEMSYEGRNQQQQPVSFLLNEIMQEEQTAIQNSESHHFKIEPVEELIFDSHLNASTQVDDLIDFFDDDFILPDDGLVTEDDLFEDDQA